MRLLSERNKIEQKFLAGAAIRRVSNYDLDFFEDIDIPVNLREFVTFDWTNYDYLILKKKASYVIWNFEDFEKHKNDWFKEKTGKEEFKITSFTKRHQTDVIIELNNSTVNLIDLFCSYQYLNEIEKKYKDCSRIKIEYELDGGDK